MNESLVVTVAGPVTQDRLQRRYSEMETADDITVAREWWLDGQMVRRDVWVTMKRGFDLSVVKGA